MRKDRNELNEVLNTMVEMLGAEQVLQELANAQDTRELQENLEYISDMWDLDLFEEGEWNGIITNNFKHVKHVNDWYTCNILYTHSNWNDRGNLSLRRGLLDQHWIHGRNE